MQEYTGKGRSGRKEQIRRAVELYPAKKQFSRWLAIMKDAVRRKAIRWGVCK